MQSLKRPLLVLGLAALAAVWVITGCAEDVTRLTAQNELEVFSAPDSFTIDIQDMENLYEELSYDWVVTTTQVHVAHRSFVPHGESDLRLIDAAGDTVYSQHLLFELEGQSEVGVPGTWKVQLELFGVTGRVGVTLTAIP